MESGRNLEVALEVALLWFAVGITLAVGYFVNLFRSIRGKVGEDANGHGY